MAAARDEYRDRLFNFLFWSSEHKEWTLSLYNAVNGTSYTDPEQITITTIRQVLYMGMHNDVSFMIVGEMNLYEQQSSFNPNIPLRMLQYVGHLYEKLITEQKKNKYGRTLIRLPVPKLVVFYNGTDEQPDESILRLSDAFDENRRADADVQVRVRMVNINQGHSAQLMSACEPLREYTEFISRVQELEATMSLQSAIDQAITEMPDAFVIKQYLEAHKSEVKEMLTTEYNEKKQMELFYEDGKQEGIQAGEKRFSKLMSMLFAVNRSNDAMRALNDTEYRQKLYEEFQIA